MLDDISCKILYMRPQNNLYNQTTGTELLPWDCPKVE